MPALRNATAMCVLVAGCTLAAGCTKGASANDVTTPPATAVATTEARPASTPPPPPSVTSTSTTTPPALTYVFPFTGKKVSYAHTHHDYPASDVFGCGAGVVAPVRGTVEETRTVDPWVPKVDDPATRGGKYVSMEGDDGVRYYFAHLASVAVTVGERVAAGDPLGVMQTDHIDLYQMHHVDRNASWDEIWQAMDTLVQQGKIIYVGSSNFAGWHITKANERARARNSFGLVSEQSHYNLLVRTVELEVLPACRDYGVGLIPWSPLAGGVLGGVLGNEETSRRKSPLALKRIEKMRPQLEKWEKLCAELGEEPAAVALS